MAGVFQHASVTPDRQICFVMMPFDESFNALFRLIERCCTEEGLTCIRADSDARPGKITSKIYDLIANAGIIIADMTGRNPNVFYELGLAHAVTDNVILLTQDREDVPFDLRDFIHIEYRNTLDGAEKLLKDLAKALTSITRSAGSLSVPVPVMTKEVPPAEVEELGDLHDVDFLQLYAEAARKRGDKATARRLIDRALERARARDGSANAIGNCAIEAEANRFIPQAEELYEIALAMDPEHVNNRQCYVSFLLDEYPNDPAKLDKAGAMLDGLEHETERLERTRVLRVQYASIRAAKDRTGEEDVDATLKALLEGTDMDSVDQAAPALVAMMMSGKIDELQSLIETLRTRVPESEHDRLNRILADALAERGLPRDRATAIELYRALYSRGDRDAGLLHNLATLLFHEDRSDTGGEILRLWTGAYATDAGNPVIRKAFAQFLMRQRRLDDADLVLRGKPLPG
jgi:hypothetical protein